MCISALPNAAQSSALWENTRFDYSLIAWLWAFLIGFFFHVVFVFVLLTDYAKLKRDFQVKAIFYSFVWQPRFHWVVNGRKCLMTVAAAEAVEMSLHQHTHKNAHTNMAVRVWTLTASICT